MLEKAEFLKRYNLCEDQFVAAEISWNELNCIFEDYKDKQKPILEKVLNDFNLKYLNNLSHMGLHSIKSRVKDEEHLIEKIIRKRNTDYSGYEELNSCNYTKIVTDLIGIRGFILFKEDWIRFHNYITKVIENNPRIYIKKRVSDYDPDYNHTYHAEPPKAHIRDGDDRSIYTGLSPDCIKDGKIYRSIHYIIKFEGVYIEIQIRTLFEESWGEIDHSLLYPYYMEDDLMKKYTAMLNRLSGLADEMGSFFRYIKNSYKNKDMVENSNIESKEPEEIIKCENMSMQEEKEAKEKVEATPKNLIAQIFNE